jgi:hypothetical protein
MAPLCVDWNGLGLDRAAYRDGGLISRSPIDGRVLGRVGLTGPAETEAAMVAAMLGRPWKAAALAMVTKCPRPAAAMLGRKTLPAHIVPRRFTSTTSRRCSGSASMKLPPTPMPAQVNTRSTPPCVFRKASAEGRYASRSATSNSAGCTVAPRAAQLSTTWPSRA